MKEPKLDAQSPTKPVADELLADRRSGQDEVFETGTQACPRSMLVSLIGNKTDSYRLT